MKKFRCTVCGYVKKVTQLLRNVLCVKLLQANS